jgi:hypothetical protein
MNHVRRTWITRKEDVQPIPLPFTRHPKI